MVRHFKIDDMKMNKMWPALLVGMVWFLARPAFGQTDSVSDDELHKYAVVMDSIDVMKQQLLDSMTEMVQHNPKITAERYNELNTIIGDSLKLVDAKATPDEITAVKEIVSFRNDGQANLNKVFQSLAQDYLGASTYYKVKKALSSDGALKEKYDSMLQQIKQEESEGKKGQG